jgi:hypothetical protein
MDAQSIDVVLSQLLFYVSYQHPWLEPVSRKQLPDQMGSQFGLIDIVCEVFH